MTVCGVCDVCGRRYKFHILVDGGVRYLCLAEKGAKCVPTMSVFIYVPCVLTCNVNPQACVCCACGFAGSVYGPGTSNDMPPRPLLYPLLHACCVVPGVAADSLGRLASKLRKAMWPTSPDYFALCWQQHWCVATPPYRRYHYVLLWCCP